MRLTALPLLLAAAGFAGFGLAFRFAPGALAVVDLTPVTPAARSDVRAAFGGMEVGVGVFLALAYRVADPLLRAAWAGAAVAEPVLP